MVIATQTDGASWGRIAQIVTIATAPCKTTRALMPKIRSVMNLFIVRRAQIAQIVIKYLRVVQATLVRRSPQVPVALLSGQSHPKERAETLAGIHLMDIAMRRMAIVIKAQIAVIARIAGASLWRRETTHAHTAAMEFAMSLRIAGWAPIALIAVTLA